MEYDIIVKPGASPSRVQLAYDGVEDVQVNDNGELEITLNSPLKSLLLDNYFAGQIIHSRI